MGERKGYSEVRGIMIAIVNNNAVVINNSTSHRANVIAKRTNSDVMGVVC